MTKTIVVNIKDDPTIKQHPDFVYIGRPSKWGNPYIVGLHGLREVVIGLYKQNVASHESFKKMVKEELEGKILGCYCKPKACHGDVLLEILNESSL